MRAEGIQDLLLQKPFRPFRLYLTDGSKHDITHPDMIWLTRYYMQVGTPIREGARIVEKVNHVALLHVVRAELLDGQRTKRTAR